MKRLLVLAAALLLTASTAMAAQVVQDENILLPLDSAEVYDDTSDYVLKGDNSFVNYNVSTEAAATFTINVTALTQTGGNTTAFAANTSASGSTVKGMVSNKDFTINGGSFTAGAIGGTLRTAYGLSLENGANLTVNNADFYTFRSGGHTPAHSVHVEGNVIFENGAVYRPMILQTADDDTAGYIVAEGSIEFKDGLASIKPYALDSIKLDIRTADDDWNDERNRILRSEGNNFVDKASLTGYVETATLRYNITSGGDNLYSQTQRVAWGSEVTSGNTSQMLAAIEATDKGMGLPEIAIAYSTTASAILTDYLTTGGANLDPELVKQLNRMMTYAEFDNAGSVAAMEAVGRDYSAWGATRLNNMAMQRMDAVQSVVNQNLTGNVPGDNANAFVTNAGNATPLNVWIAPVYSYQKHDAKTSEFKDTDGYFTGASFGIAKQFKIGTLAIGAHYLYGKEDGGGYKAESDTFGVMAGYRSNPIFNNAAFSPWFQANFGYAYSDIDQSRKATGDKYTANIDQHTLRLGVAFGQDFWCNTNLRLTPIAGVDLTYADFDSYSEKGGLNAQEVDGDSLTSVRFKFGAEAAYGLTQKFDINAHAFYRVEAADTQASLNTYFPAMDMTFKTKGEDYSRSSGNFGLGLSYQITERMSLGGMYDFTIGDKQQEHLFNLNFKVAF